MSRGSDRAWRPPRLGRAAGRALVAANAVALAALWGLVLGLWPLLPARVPLHFGREGLPDRWGEPSASAWLPLPIAATVMTLLMVALGPLVGLMARRWPWAINMPRKKEFLALPADSRERAVAPLGVLLLAFPLPFDWLAGWIAWGAYEVAIGARDSLSVWPLFAAMGVEFALAIWSLAALRRSVLCETAKAAPEAPLPHC